jgi:hypothetical protein
LVTGHASALQETSKRPAAFWQAQARPHSLAAAQQRTKSMAFLLAFIAVKE